MGTDSARVWRLRPGREGERQGEKGGRREVRAVVLATRGDLFVLNPCLVSPRLASSRVPCCVSSSRLAANSNSGKRRPRSKGKGGFPPSPPHTPSPLSRRGLLP